MKITEKLKKLLAHAKSAKEIGNEAEAEAFAAKIQQLLDQHNLSMSDIDVEAERETLGKTDTGIRIGSLWQQRFLNSLAAIQGVVLLQRGSFASLVGNETDREIVEDLYLYFEALAQHFCGRYIKEWQDSAEYRRKRKKSFHTRTHKTSYLIGFTHSIIVRFEDQHNRNKSESNNETALVYVGRKLDDSKAWLLRNIKTTERDIPFPKKSRLNGDAFFAGRADGNNVALTSKTMGRN